MSKQAGREFLFNGGGIYRFGSTEAIYLVIRAGELCFCVHKGGKEYQLLCDVPEGLIDWEGNLVSEAAELGQYKEIRLLPGVLGSIVEAEMAKEEVAAAAEAEAAAVLAAVAARERSEVASLRLEQANARFTDFDSTIISSSNGRRTRGK